MDWYIESGSEAEEERLESPGLRTLRAVPCWNAIIYANFQEGSVFYTEGLFKPSLLDLVRPFLYYDKVRRHILRHPLRTSIKVHTNLLRKKKRSRCMLPVRVSLLGGCSQTAIVLGYGLKRPKSWGGRSWIPHLFIGNGSAGIMVVACSIGGTTGILRRFFVEPSPFARRKHVEQ